jgi:hypothetical protein
MSNYQHPYVEDYFSDIDPAEAMALEEAMHDRRGENPFLYDDRLYGDEFGGPRGPY